MNLAPLLLLLALVLGTPSGDDTSKLNDAHKPGVFYGTLKLQPTGDGVHMLVLEAYSYADFDGHMLAAQQGFSTDGASIPRPLWTFVGSPFTGKYLGAAVIHDVGCVSHKYGWQITDRMFYDAMLDLGVSEHQAKILYYGVRFGGPKWQKTELSARTKAALDEKILKSGAISITETAGTTAPSHHAVSVIVPSPTHTLTETDLKAFAQELTRREKTNNPISETEIEKRTEPPLQP